MLFGFGSTYYHSMGGSRPTRLDASTTAHLLQHNNNNNNDDDDIVQVACTSTATIYVTRSGQVHQVGTMHGTIYKVPTRIVVELPLKVVQVAAGRHFCVGRMEGGLAAVSWGAGHFGQLGQGPNVCHLSKPRVMEHLLPHRTGGSPIQQVAVGSWHGMALTQAGTIYAWGSNRRWQCGIKRSNNNNTNDSTSSRPTLVYPQPIDTGGVCFTKICCGKSHSVGLAVGGKVYTWGASQVGQCGHATRRATIAPPRLVEALAKVVILDVAAGDAHTLALTGGGRVFGWGSGLEGQLGIGTAVPMARPKLVDDLDFVAICARQEQYKQKKKNDATAETDSSPILTDFCAGINPQQQLQDESLSSSNNSPHQLSTVPKIVRVEAAGSYSVALSSSGHAYVWGYNDVGVLGLKRPPVLPFCEPLLTSSSFGEQDVVPRMLQVRTFDSRHNVLLPRRVDALQNYRVVQVAGGPSHLWLLCEPRVKIEPIGRTLYEVQHEKIIIQQQQEQQQQEEQQEEEEGEEITQTVLVQPERLEDSDEEDENDSDEAQNGKFVKVAQSEPPPKPKHRSSHRRITRLMKRLSTKGSKHPSTSSSQHHDENDEEDDGAKKKGARQVLSQVFCKSER